MRMFFRNRSRVLLGFFFLFSSATISIAQTVKPITEKGLDSLLSNRNGTMLVLNIWATWCEPCKEEFPDLIKLSAKYKKKDVQFAAISVDYPDEVESKILPFIDSLHVPFVVYVADFPSQDSLINTINKEWSGGVPATVIYDRKGKRQQFLFGKQPYQKLKGAIDNLLRKK